MNNGPIIDWGAEQINGASMVIVPGAIPNDIVLFDTGGQVKDSGKQIATVIGSDNTTVPTSLAVQTAINNTVTSAKSFRGGYNASTNLFPATGGSGLAGAIVLGDTWEITVQGVLNGTTVYVGNSITALANTPGQTAANWNLVITGVYSVFGRFGAVVASTGDYSFAQISGAAAINQGGTGQVTQQAAINALTLPITSGTYLRSDGANASFANIQAADIPTLNQDTSGTAAHATNIVGGGAGSVPYQSGANTTAMLAANSTATTKSLKSVSSGNPAWTQDTIAECSDYASGTWTPTDVSGAGLTLTSVAEYVKIGAIVYCLFSITYPTTADATVAQIGGLPFTVKNVLSNRGGSTYQITSATSAVATVSAVLAGTAFKLNNVAGSGNVTNINLTGATIRGLVMFTI